MALAKIINFGDSEVILYTGVVVATGEDIVLAQDINGFPLLIVDSDGNLKIRGTVSRI